MLGGETALLVSDRVIAKGFEQLVRDRQRIRRKRQALVLSIDLVVLKSRHLSSDELTREIECRVVDPESQCVVLQGRNLYIRFDTAAAIQHTSIRRRDRTARRLWLRITAAVTVRSLILMRIVIVDRTARIISLKRTAVRRVI